MSSTNSRKFLDLFNNVDEYKQVNKNKIEDFNNLKIIYFSFRQSVQKLLMLFEHLID